jgi:formate hydrogenlyase transcriptional activator
VNRILIIDDDKAVLNYFQVLLLQTERFEVEALADSAKAFDTIDSGRFDLLLLDMDMPGVTGKEVLKHVQRNHPGLEVVIITGVEDVELAVESMKMGAYDYLCKPVDDSRLLTTLDRALERSRLRGEIDKLRDRISLEGLRHKEEFRGILTQDRKFLRSLRKVEQIAESDNNVLIWGESGTGKELVARAIHRIGRRRDNPFVAVNAGTFASALFSSEFFGHDKGAFTGAVAVKRGKFEIADRGTLFLDEVGDIPLELQSKLLRVLQEQEFERLGSTRTIRVNVRLVAATNVNLAEKVAENQFRSDLYYRLNVFPVTMPALRERREDIPLLVRYFAQKYAGRMKKPIDNIPANAMSALTEYHWPGNVRELENFIERAVILSRGTELQIPLAELKQRTKLTAVVPRDGLVTLAHAEREHIVRALSETNWVIGGNAGAAARLGMKRTTLQSRMRKLGITRHN